MAGHVNDRKIEHLCSKLNDLTDDQVRLVLNDYFKHRPEDLLVDIDQMDRNSMCQYLGQRLLSDAQSLGHYTSADIEDIEAILRDDLRDEVPDALKCPYGQTIMLVPVTIITASTATTYNEQSVTEWFAEGHQGTDPLTREQIITPQAYYPSPQMEEAVNMWLIEHTAVSLIMIRNFIQSKQRYTQVHSRPIRVVRRSINLNASESEMRSRHIYELLMHRVNKWIVLNQRSHYSVASQAPKDDLIALIRVELDLEEPYVLQLDTKVALQVPPGLHNLEFWIDASGDVRIEVADMSHELLRVDVHRLDGIIDKLLLSEHWSEVSATLLENHEEQASLSVSRRHSPEKELRWLEPTVNKNNRTNTFLDVPKGPDTSHVGRLADRQQQLNRDRRRQTKLNTLK